MINWLKKILRRWLLKDMAINSRVIQTPSETVVVRTRHEIDDRTAKEQVLMQEIYSRMRHELIDELFEGNLIESTSERSVINPNTVVVEMQIMVVKPRV